MPKNFYKFKTKNSTNHSTEFWRHPLSMSFSFAKKQNYIYLACLLVAIVTAVFIYRHVERKWILLREAEEKFYDKAFPEAIDLYEQSLSYGPTNEHAYLNLAHSYVAIGNFPAAIKYYRIYLNEHPGDANIRLLLARTLGWSGNFQEAEKEYQKLMKDSDEPK